MHSNACSLFLIVSLLYGCGSPPRGWQSPELASAEQCERLVNHLHEVLGRGLDDNASAMLGDALRASVADCRRSAAEAVECKLAATTETELSRCPVIDARAPGERPTAETCNELRGHIAGMPGDDAAMMAQAYHLACMRYRTRSELVCYQRAHDLRSLVTCDLGNDRH